MEKMKASAEREEGPWFAVHRGYEVQIAGGGDEFHRHGSDLLAGAVIGGVRKNPANGRR